MALTLISSFPITAAGLLDVRDITNDGSKLYILGRTSSTLLNANYNVIRRFSLSGTFESAGNATITLPSPPSQFNPSARVRRQESFIKSFSYYNNSFYVLVGWWGGFYQTVERYNSSFVHQETIYTRQGSSVTINPRDPSRFIIVDNAIAINNGNIYIHQRHYFRSGITIGYRDQLQIRNASNGNLIDGTNTYALSSSLVLEGLAVNNTRLFSYSLTLASDTSPRGFYGLTHTGSEDSAIFTAHRHSSDLNRARAGSFAGGIAYPNSGFRRSGSRALTATTNSLYYYSYNGITRLHTNPSAGPSTATWSNENFCFTSDKVQGTLTFNNNVSGIDLSDFAILDANNMDSVVGGWTFDTPPTTARINTGITIRSTPPAQTRGSYKLRLKSDTVSGPYLVPNDSPEDDADSSSINVDNREDPDEMASITIDSGSFCTTSKRITWQAYVTGGNAMELGNLDTADITVNRSDTSVSVTLTITRTPSTGSSYRIQTTAIPDNKTGNMSITIRANALGANSNPFGVTSACVGYDTSPEMPVVGVTGEWVYASWCETSNKIQAALRFNKAIENLNVNTNAAMNSSIYVRNETKRTNLTTGWTFSFSGHTGTNVNSASLAANTNLVIEVTPPANTRVNVYLWMPPNSITSGTENGPQANLYTEVINVDNRPAPGEPPSISIDGGTYCTTSRRITWTAYVNGATDSELMAFTNADTTINNSTSVGTIFTPMETVTRSPATGSSYQIQTDPIPVDRVGEMSVTVAANALGTGTNKSVTSSCVSYDTRADADRVTATAVWSTPAAQTGVNAVLQARLTFRTNTNVTGIEPGDFDVITTGNAVHPEASWTMQVSHNFTDSERAYVDVTAIPAGTFNHRFGLRLKEESVRSDDSCEDNAPAANVDSTLAAFDNRDTREPSVPQIIIGTGGFCPTSRKLTWPVSVINSSATQFAALMVDDITITDSSTATPALSEVIVSRATNSLLIEIEVPTGRNGTASITIRADALGMSTNTAVTSNVVSYDTRVTTASTTITYGTPVVSNTDRDIEFPMTFSDIGDGLEASDFSISATNGTWTSTLRDGTGGVQTKVLEVSNGEMVARMGTLNITLAEDAFTNRTITGGRTSDDASYNFESTIATTTITYVTSDVRTNDRTVIFVVQFSNIGEGLTSDDFTFTASVGTWTVTLGAGLGSDTRTVTLLNTETVARAGTISLTINEDAFTDRQITGDRTSSDATFNFGAATGAVVTISLDRTTGIRQGQRYNVLFNWDRDVTGFDADDITVSAGLKGTLVGSGREYKLSLTAPSTGIQEIITVRQNAVDQTNAITRYSIRLGTGPRMTPTVIESSRIIGDGLAYTPDDIYTIAQTQLPDEASPRIRAYSQAGVLQTNVQTTLTGLLNSRLGHSPAIEILDERFLMSIHRFDRFGIARADSYIDNVSFEEFFLDIGTFIASTSESTDTEILDIAIGGNRIYVLSSGGSFESPSYNIDIFDLNGRSVGVIAIDTVTQESDAYRSVPSALAVTGKFLYVGFASFRSRSDSALLSGDILFAYDLNGSRMSDEDIELTDISGTAARFGIKSMDWDETNERLWMLIDRGRVESDVNYGYFAHLALPQAVDAQWSTIEPQTMRSGETFDLKDYAANITTINYAPGVAQPSWLTLSNGVVTVAMSGLPSVNTSVLVSFIGIGSGAPDYISFTLNLLRQTPRWLTIPAQVLERGDTIDLNQFITGADTISFRSGHTIPLGLTIEDGIIQIPGDATTSTEQTVNVSGTNPIGTAHASFSLQIVNSAIDIRDLSFQQEAVQWRVHIGTVDISEHVHSVDNIFHSLDLYDTGEFLASECTIVLKNNLRLYQRNGPFYTDNSINPYTDEIIVTGRLGNVTRRLFTGILWGITEIIGRQEVSWLCLERTRALQNTQVVNFGNEKYDISLIPQDAGPIGTYAIPSGLTPIADESLSLTTEGRPMNVVTDQALRIFGQLDILNAKQTDNSVNTEGGLLETTPKAVVKSPLTYIEAGDYIEQFLSHEGIVNRSVVAPTLPAGTDAWYESIGRAGFDVERTDILRYTKDWIYDSSSKVFYILAGGPSKIAQDYLWKWTPESDLWERIGAFDSEMELWQLASSDYNVFYIMGTAARDNLDILPNGTYDSSEAETGSPSLIKIWRYTASTESMTEYISGSNSYPPTLAHYYSVGFSRENANTHRFGMMPDTRGGFAIRSNRLYYRYATGSAFGIAQANLSNGTTSSFVNAGAVDTFGNAGGLAFHISGSRMYFGYTRAPTDPAELTIASRSFTSSTVRVITTLNDPSDGERYAFTGVQEIFVHGSTLYFVTQKHPRDARSPNRRQYQNNASATLYQTSTSTSSTATVLKEYDYTQTAARSFVLHNGSVHFFEGSPVAYKYPPQEDFSFPVERMDQIQEAQWKDQIGFLKRISGSSIVDVGLVWRSVLENPLDPNDSHYGIHGGMCSPMISADGTLYMVAAYGNFDLIGRENAEINHVYNDAIITYGTNNKFRIPQVDTNRRTVYSLLQEISNSTNCVFGVDNQRFFWKTRLNVEAQLSSTMAISDSTLSYDSATASFADSGFLRIGSEVMSYTGRTDTSITGLTRGIAGTSASAHSNNDVILHVDHVIYGRAVTTPVKELFIEDDYTNLHNSIFIRYGGGRSIAHREDTASIALYGKRERSVETFLHFTQIDWANSLADSYLRTFKDLEQIVRFNSNLALFLNVGDVIYLESKEIEAAMRIYEISHDFLSKSTSITARTISY